MFKEIVRVISADSDKVTISFDKKKMCSCCRYSGLCGTGEGELIIENNLKLPLKEGDRIEVGIEEKKTILAYLILFLIPAIIFLGSLILARSLGPLFSFLLALACVLIYYLIVKGIVKKRGRYFNLKILRKL